MGTPVSLQIICLSSLRRKTYPLVPTILVFGDALDENARRHFEQLAVIVAELGSLLVVAMEVKAHVDLLEVLAKLQLLVGITP